MKQIKQVIKRIPGFKNIDQFLRNRYNCNYSSEKQPKGHYSSLYPDIDYIRSKAAEIFNKDINLGPGIDLRVDAQFRSLETLPGSILNSTGRNSPQMNSDFTTVNNGFPIVMLLFYIH